MDWTTIIAVATPIIGFLTLFGVWLGPRLAERSRRIHQARQLHLESLKSKVFQPLLYQLENYFLPVIGRENSNIIEKSESIALPEISIDEYGAVNRITLSIKTLEDTLEDWEMQDFGSDASGLRPLERPKLKHDPQLYEDVKENHEPRLVDSWENFLAKVNEYNCRCLEYVKQLAQLLAKQTRLIVWDHYESKPGMNTAGIAAFIWERQIGLGSSHFFIEKSENPRVSIANKIVAVGTNDEITRCRQVVDSLVKDRAQADKLMNLAGEMELEEKALSLKKEFTDLIHSQKLRGNCKYTNQ